MGYKKPLEIKLQLTEKCNYDCDFCFNKQGLSSKGRQISKNLAEKIISNIASQGIEKIRFTGGEPLLHPNLLGFLSLAKKKGLFVMLNTNASLINKGNAKEIAKNCDNVLVSMHSLPPSPKAVAGIKSLSEEGCSPKAATILTKENIQILEQFHKLIQKMPFSQWVLLRQIPNQLNKNPVSNKDMEIAVEKIESFNKGRKKKDLFLIENALPFCCFHPNRVSKVALGGVHEDGHSSLFVDVNGNIRPSYFFDLVLGNALDTSFSHAWKTEFMQRMNSLEFIGEICHNCKYALQCMAGSRFAALFVNKSLYALDPLAKPSDFPPSLLIEINK